MIYIQLECMHEQQGGKLHDRASQPVSTHESVCSIPVTTGIEVDCMSESYS